tara:strand:- start:86487 stop:86984 length:498 start_codon:yes stop_codon:yes gene_type:complete
LELEIHKTNFGELAISENSSIIAYSKLKNTWFRGANISIFNVENKLVAQLNAKGLFYTTYSFKYVDEDFIGKNLTIKTRLLLTEDLLIENKKVLSLKNSWFELINPISKIIANNVEIGQVKRGRVLKHKKMKVTIHEQYSSLLNYFILLFLSTETATEGFGADMD